MSTVGAFILALRSAKVQTAAVAILTDELSRSLQVEAHIGRVEVRPPLAMYLQDIFLSDQQGDTLLAIPEVKVRFNPFKLEDKCLCFPLVQLSNPTIRLVQDSASTNLDFLLRAFRSDSSASTFSYGVECRNIVVDNARIHYVHRPSGMDVMLSDMNTSLGFQFQGKDQLSAQLRYLHIKASANPVDGYMEADLHGSLDTIFADNLSVVYRGKRLFMGNVFVNQPLSRDLMTAQINCTDLYANARLISSLISEFTHQPIQLPSSVESLGDIHYRGTIGGSLGSLRLTGAFRTRIGTLSTNAVLRDQRSLQARLSTRNLDLGRWLQSADLGHLSAVCTVDALLDKANPKAKLSVKVSQLEYKDYVYSDMALNGTYDSNTATCQLAVNDDHLTLSLGADVQNMLTAPTTSIDVVLSRLDLVPLHLSKSELNHQIVFRSSIRMQTDTNAANIVDATYGSIQFDSIGITGGGKHLSIPNLAIVVEADSAGRHMRLESPVMNANVDGHFQWTTIPATIKGLIHQSIPSLVDMPTAHEYCNDMDFQFTLTRAEELFQVLLGSKMRFPSQPVLSGFVHETEDRFSIEMLSPEVTIRNSAYQDMLLKLDNDNPQRFTSGRFGIKQHIISKDSTRLRIGDVMFGLHLLAHNDSLSTALEFGPVSEADSIPDILVHTTFAQLRNKPYINIHFMPSAFQIGPVDWQVQDSRIQVTAADKQIMFDQVRFFTQRQSLQIDGCMSASTSDSLMIQLRDVDLGYLLSATKIVDAIDLRGKLNGSCVLRGAFSTPQVEADVEMLNAQINGTDLGRVMAKATMDRQTGDMHIVGDAVLDDVCLAKITGLVQPKRPAYWELNVDANGLPLSFINFWTDNILSDVDGRAYGQVHIFGRNRRTWVTARAYAKDAALTIPYTGCRYYFSDSVVMDTAYIAFPKIHLYDAEGHSAILSGRINHTNFTGFDFNINAQCVNLEAINLPSSPQGTYYGHAYATGKVDITGDPSYTLVDVNASTVGNTDFYLSLATASSASSSEFITFRQPPSLLKDTVVEEKIKTKPASHFYLNLNIEATPQARVHLVLDQHNGDGIVGRGEGNIRLTMDASTGDLQLLGTYSLMNGTFSYTVGNLVHRDFAIAEGSTVSWSGDAANPKLDITAKYRCTASLRDLFGSDVKSVTSRSSIPVDCVVHITGEMNNMILNFGIEYPQSDESVSAQINAVINTEAMLMRQVVYLLVFNRFYTPDYMRVDSRSTGLNDAYSLLSSTVTGQINSWLSKLTSMVNVGFNMRSDGEVGNRSYETEANIQIQPVDRLTINGNVGYRYNDLTNQPFFGDADVEYELTPDGKFRAKVFTHSVDQYSLHQSGMQSGIGFVFRHDFNPGDAKKRRETKTTHRGRTP